MLLGVPTLTLSSLIVIASICLVRVSPIRLDHTSVSPSGYSHITCVYFDTDYAIQHMMAAIVFSFPSLAAIAAIWTSTSHTD